MMSTTLGGGAAAETPNTKLQAPDKHQITNIKPAGRRTAANALGAWGLELLWFLELGVWCFISLWAPPHSFSSATRRRGRDRSHQSRPGSIGTGRSPRKGRDVRRRQSSSSLGSSARRREPANEPTVSPSVRRASIPRPPRRSSHRYRSPD